MSKKMKTGVFYAVLSIGLLSCAAFAVFLYQVDDAAKQLVKDYWSLILENKIGEANKLTAIKTREKPPMTRIGRVDGTNDCCLQDIIFELQMKFEKIIDVQVFRENAGKEYKLGSEIQYVIAPTVAMTIEIIDKKQEKTNLAVCLGKSIENDEWRIRKITYLEESDKLADKCLDF